MLSYAGSAAKASISTRSANLAMYSLAVLVGNPLYPYPLDVVVLAMALSNWFRTLVSMTSQGLSPLKVLTCSWL